MRSELIGLPEPNWFHHGEQILALLERYRPTECVELGSNRGCSAIAIARVIRLWRGVLTCVDTWGPGLGGDATIEEFAANVREAGVGAHVRMVQSTTQQAAKAWPGMRQIDFLYVDADHSRDGCYADLSMWWPLLRPGALVAGDDYDDPSGIPEQGVTRAWDDFEAHMEQSFSRTRTPGLAIDSRLIWGLKR